MKRFLSIVAVLVLLFALTVPALAAESSPKRILLEEGGSVTFTAKGSSTPRTATLHIVDSSAMPDDASVGSGNKVLAVYDATLTYDDDGSDASADFFQVYEALEIDFGARLTTAVTKVLHGPAPWTSEPFTGSVVTVSSLSPFALIVKADSSGGTPQPGQTSPQTGYNTALWTVSAVAMVLCAGFCFTQARRKDAE